MKEHLAKIEAYGKAHWKELLALVLAAIPAGFLIFHKGAQQTAANAISYIPAAFGAGDSGATPGSGGPGGDPGTQLAAAAGLTAQPSSTILGTSVNGSSPKSSPSIPKTGPSAPPSSTLAGIAAAAPQGGPNISTRNTSGAQSTFQNFLRVISKYIPSPQVVAQHTAAAAPIGAANLSRRTTYVAPAPIPSAPAAAPFNPIKSRSSGSQAL